MPVFVGRLGIEPSPDRVRACCTALVLTPLNERAREAGRRARRESRLSLPRAQRAIVGRLGIEPSPRRVKAGRTTLVLTPLLFREPGATGRVLFERHVLSPKTSKAAEVSQGGLLEQRTCEVEPPRYRAPDWRWIRGTASYCAHTSVGPLRASRRSLCASVTCSEEDT